MQDLVDWALVTCFYPLLVEPATLTLVLLVEMMVHLVVMEVTVQVAVAQR